MQRSKIEWTDYSGDCANFVWRGRRPGDCECSPGCAHCYVTRAMQRASHWPEITTFFPDKLAQLARCRPTPGNITYRRGSGSRPMVFVCDTGDLFHPLVAEEQIFAALDVLVARDDIDWQLLTKRAARLLTVAQRYCQGRGLERLPDNIWGMVTACNQAEADEKIPALLAAPFAMRGVSVEPMLGAMDLSQYSMCGFFADPEAPHYAPKGTIGCPEDKPVGYGLRLRSRLDWVIVGGESGAAARPINPAWVRALRDQCQDADTALFFKQWGEFAPANWHHDTNFVGGICADDPRGGQIAYNPQGSLFHMWDGGALMMRVGKAKAGARLDGKRWQKWPR